MNRKTHYRVDTMEEKPTMHYSACGFNFHPTILRVLKDIRSN